MANEDLSVRFPLHWPVWHNNYEQLRTNINLPDVDLEQQDARGRTVLHLSVSLGHLECARLLLHHGANVLSENQEGWSVLHEAISTGDPEMVSLILQHRDFKQASIRLEGVPKLLSELRNAPDFYVEMKWEFNSWIPLLSKVCPSDVCKIWKKGSSIRVDTTLLGFENMTWKRGSRSFVFKGCDQGATLLDINHDAKEVIEEVLFDDNVLTRDMFSPGQNIILQRLTNPVICTHLNVDAIQLEMSQQGFLGWRSDRYETINGHNAAVFSASNVEIITKTRSEHVDDKDSKKPESSNLASRFLKSFSGFSLEHNASENTQASGLVTASNPDGLTPEQYFSSEFDPTTDIGRPKEVSVKTQKFKGCLWMCKDYPLSLKDQVLPIIDLMSTTSPHFKKLSDFIKMKLPQGFPVKIEIPVFHVLNACVTFEAVQRNRDEEDSKVPFVSYTPPEDADGALDSDPLIQVDPACFEAPEGYHMFNISSRQTPSRVDEDERLLQLAIQESLSLQSGTETDQVTLMEALNNTSPNHARPLPSPPNSNQVFEDEFEKVLRLSALEAETSKKRQLEEEEELKRVLELSMLEN